MDDPKIKMNGHALSEFLEYAKPALILDKLAKVRDPWTERYYHEARLKRGYTLRLHQIDCYATDVEGVSCFIEAVKEQEKARGECEIRMNEYGMTAEWEERTPLTPAQIKESEDWLAANPRKEGTIKISMPNINLEK